MTNANEFELFRKTLSQFSPIPDEVWEKSKTYFYLRTLNQNEDFQKPGDLPTEVGIVMKGFLRAYFTSPNKTQKTILFAKPGQVMGSYTSYLSNNKCELAITAEEPSKIICIRHDDMKNLFAIHPCWLEIGRRLVEQLLQRRERRELQLLTMSALERYEEFLKEFPDLLDDVPQWQIASYLGITPVALSRLRAQRVRKAKKL